MERRESWSGRVGFVLALIGSAVGLGSIWKFPYEVGANGGSAFVLFYLLGLALVVVPLMFAELAIGRRGRGDPSTSIRAVAAACGASRWWDVAGALGVLTGFLILSFYSVIGGWTLDYAAHTVLEGLPRPDAPSVRERYASLLASPWRMLAGHLAFMGLTIAIVARGISGGIEAASRVLMPLLAALMVALAAYSVVVGDPGAALRFLFELDCSRVTARAALEALGLGFFSIGVGLGLMITYAAYAGSEIDLRAVGIVTVVGDTAISLMAGLAVFPIVFAHGLDPAGGPGLVFVTLPLAFAQMPFGALAAVAFFVLLFVAALASAISLLELAVALLVRRFGWRRGTAAVAAGAACAAAGVPTVLSFNLWADWHPAAAFGVLVSYTFFDVLDHVTSNVLLPACGFAIAVFAGWGGPARMLADELGLGARGARALRLALRWIVPAGIAAAAVSALAG